MFRPFPRFTLSLAALCALAFASAFAQDAELGESEEIPFQGEDRGLGLDKRRDAYWLEGSAERALEAGLYDIAFALAVESEAKRDGQAISFGNQIVAIDASLARSNWIEASERIEAVLSLKGSPAARLTLRKAMIGFAEKDVQAVQGLLSGIEMTSLTDRDIAWFWFLRGWTQLQLDDANAAGQPFANARRLAAQQSPALHAQISYLIFRGLLDARTAGVDTIPLLQNALVEHKGREISYAYAQQLAVLLFDRGRFEEAIQLIVRSLESIPKELALEKAQFQLLATMAAGLDRAEGRQAFNDLIFANRFPELMSIALQQVFSRARHENIDSSAALQASLDRLIALPQEHALLDQALYYRAVFRFLAQDFLGAEDDAATLQRKFPASPYRRGMLALQASSAWNRSRFRTAASYLQQMRSEFSDLRSDARLSALIADCYLRAGLQSNTREDFRNAAEAYATALSEVKDVAQSGPLFFQLVMARLRAGQLDEALEAIDNPRLRLLAGGEMIWRAEWMALKEMRRVWRVSDAYDRVQSAITSNITDPSLRLRLLWLAARLSVQAGQPEDTVEWVTLVDEFAQGDQVSSIEQDLLNKVRSSSLLSLAEAHFAMDEPEEAVLLLERLRSDYPGYEPALFSYIVQARYLSSINRKVEAQQLLVSLADDYKDNRLAPIALFEAALNAEQRGQDAYLNDATKLLQRIASDYPESEMVYRARLMQADLLRRLNKFPSAERIYEFLENEYSDRPDRFLAQMSLADTLIAQAGEDPRKFDAAVSRLELLMDLPENLAGASLDLRVEAGYKLAQAWRSRGETVKAKQIFWMLYDLAIVEEPRIRLLTRKGRYWLSRALFALAEISKDEGKIDQANHFYKQVIDQRLNGVELARARLEILEERPEN